MSCDAERGGGVVGERSGLVEHDAVCPFQSKRGGPEGHQRREESVDQVGGHLINPFPHRVGGHVLPRGRRRGGTSASPGDFVSRQPRAVAVVEEDGVKAPGRFAGEEVIKEPLV